MECRHELDEASLPGTAFFQPTPAHGESGTWLLKDNLDDIGSGLGILRSTIAYGVAMPSVRLDLSHDAVGEMADMYSSTHGILNCLFPDKPADDWKDVVKKITTQIKGLKSKKKA